MNEEMIDRIGRELMAAIEMALAADPRVQACLDQARSAGIGFRVALNRARAQSGVPVEGAPAQAAPAGAARGLSAPAYSVTESDRRFLRSLRIAADDE
ncbi:MAG TPA: hypothetical protein PKK95_11270 [Vicinamibacterales bacterium]|nr:hypothetical protein [Acidobacteriota bacterium]HOC18843.1 hypothetical protein [Vicinamibacterales bacterium]